MSQGSTRRFLIIAVLFVIVATLSAFADPVEMRFAGVGGQNQNGEYTYPYFLTIENGPQFPAICDDFYHESNVGDTWQANLTQLSSGDLSKTRFGILVQYQEAGYLLMQMRDDDQPEWGNINFAVWKIFNPSVDMGSTHPGTLGPQYWYNLAQTADLSKVDFSTVMIATPLDAQGASGDQEFLFLTPEPGTLILIGSGVITLLSACRRFV